MTRAGGVRWPQRPGGGAFTAGRGGVARLRRHRDTLAPPSRPARGRCAGRPGRGSVAVALALTVAAASTGCGRQLPENDVATLTARHARDLAARYAEQDLLLPLVTDIEPDVARELAAHRGGMLALPSVRTLGPESAGLLAMHDGDLWLRGLETLSAETAAALAAHRGGCLSLDGLRTLDAAARRALARHPDVTLPVAIGRPR